MHLIVYYNYSDIKGRILMFFPSITSVCSAKRLPSVWLMILFCAFYSLAVHSAPKHGPRATPVVVSVASEQFLAPTIQVPGTIVSSQQSALPAEVTGRLIWVADVGTKMKAGDVVARLDHKLYQLKVAENKASLEREIVRLRYLDKEVERLEELIKGDFTSKNIVDKMRLDRDVARSEVAVAKAKIKIDEETLRHYKVYAPFNGVVIDRVKREGEWVSSGDTVLTLSNPASLEIDARVSDKSIIYLSEGDLLTIYRKKEKTKGKIKSIVRIGDAQSHLFDIIIDVPEKNWFAGQVVRVEVPIGEAKLQLAVPRDALVLRRSGASVFRINEESKAEKLVVSTGAASGDFIGISGGIQAGDQVVIRGGERLRPGQTVKIIPGNAQ